MSDHPVAHATFTLERTYQAAPARVFAAWADPAAKARWFAGPDPLTFESAYHDIVPSARIVYSATLSARGTVATVSLTTIEFSAAGDGTRLVLTEVGAYLDGQEDPSWREQGTSQHLDRLEAELKECGNHR